MEFKKDDSGTIPESSDRSLAAGCFIKLSIKWGPVQVSEEGGFLSAEIWNLGRGSLVN